MSVARTLLGALAAGALGCSAILGLEEPTVDDTLEAGGDAGGDAQSDVPVDSPCGADLANDAKNCGACGHDCLGGACAGGACQPALVTQSTVFAPYALALDQGTIYFTNIRGPALHSVAKIDSTANDGTATQLVDYGTGYTTPPVDALVWGLSLQNGYFYTALYAGSGSGNAWEAGVDRCPLAGCTGKTLAVYGPNSYAIATNATNVFWGAADVNSNYTLQKAALDFSGAAPIATPASEVNGIALDGSTVFFGTADGVFSCKPTCGSSPITVGTVDAELLAVDANDVYFTSAGLGPPAVQEVARAGGPPKLVTNNVTLPIAVAVDATYVYFTDTGDTADSTSGKVVRCPLDGCGAATTTVLSTGAAAGDNPRGIVVDDKAVYWGTRGGKIWRLAK